MKLKLQIERDNKTVFSYSASILIHVLIFIGILSVMNIYDNRMKLNSSFVQVLSQEMNLTSNNSSEKLKQESKTNESNPGNDLQTSELKSEMKSNKDKVIKSGNDEFYNFSNVNADTAGLDQTYHESTLNVTLKYPAGWTFVDQDVKNKLDGVTFWSVSGNYSPPPYIHLDVKDKDLFSAGRFKYNSKMSGYTIYYNDPDSLEGQVTQIFYIRTNSDQDFSFKLIMEGEDAFKSFQPIFFGMIKSFKFGSAIF
ncbi:MAG: hypothetical protein M1480_20155 [Bacteroidetes bacterium]|nr:hypothetical protein [Bacteroidota bacterium]